jgi:hypothetical protein
MTYRTVATASAIVSAFYGLAALIAPEALATLYGMTLDAVARYAARLLGGSYLGYAILNFLTKDTADPLTRRALSAANAFGWAVSCVVTVFGQMQGLANLGWATVVLQLAFAAAWGWRYAAERS